MMNKQETNNQKILKETKTKIRVDFDRTSQFDRMKIKYLNWGFFGQVVFKIARFALLLGISYVILFPFFSKITYSFFSVGDFKEATVLLIPKYPTFATYKALATENHYFKAVFNTAIISILCGVVQTFICCVIGYGFAKYKFRGSKILFLSVIFMMIVPPVVLQSSLYYTFRHFSPLNIINSFLNIGNGIANTGNDNTLTLLRLRVPFMDWDLSNTFMPILILSLFGLAFKNGLYIFMMRQFFKGVPDELEESAYIDGSGVFGTFFKIILPLSIPMMITVFLFAFSWQWTDDFYVGPAFFTNNSVHLMPQFMKLEGFSLLADTTIHGYDNFRTAIQNTAGLMILLPLILVYVFCQRFLIQGIERSGITG